MSNERMAGSRSAYQLLRAQFKARPAGGDLVLSSRERRKMDALAQEACRQMVVMGMAGRVLSWLAGSLGLRQHAGVYTCLFMTGAVEL